ncbi:MAG: hypothetical protein R2731_14315 [Nocardioides sp.]
MNTTLTPQPTRDHAGEASRTTTSRTAPRLVMAASAALAALTAVGVYAWQGATSDAPGARPSAPPGGDAQAEQPSVPQAADPTRPRVELRRTDRTTFDLDGDNLLDILTLKTPVTGDGPARLVVRFGTGTRSVVAFAASGEPEFTGGMGVYGESGVPTVILGSGGGDVARWSMVAYVDGDLVPVTTVDESGSPASLQATAETPGWNTYLAGATFYDYRFPGGLPQSLPAPVELRRWVLEGTTFTRSAQTTPACWIRFDHGGVGPVFEPCG